ncbi:uncharacterized protein LOC143923235 [Arctopsyche grandis]|uniref:uncharacterized protein LOC143923235 n=1 Tax=Arctopsyche grandis TaxID=121162 RepID=UPI00406D9D28
MCPNPSRARVTIQVQREPHISQRTSFKSFVMKLSGCLVLCGLALVVAAPLEPAVASADATPVPIVAQLEEFDEKGGYKYSFESGNGIKVEGSSFVKTIPFRRTKENADLKDAPTNEEIQVLEGSYSYIAPDGSMISLKYIADENGFQPIGDHLPTPPPVPEAIQRSLAAVSEVETIQPVAQASDALSVRIQPDLKTIEEAVEPKEEKIELPVEEATK